MDTIYSVGDPLILENVLNAIAMVCGTGDFTAAVSIGGLLGVIIMGFESVLTQKGFNLPAFTVCVIAFTFFFGKTSTVYIEDVYSGETRKVSNVPSGVAFTGEAISNIGYGLTRLMEQAFQSVTATTTLTGPGGHGSPFGDALYVLNTFSRIGSSDTLINAIDMANGNADGTVGAGSKLTSGDPADFRYSASNYVKDCTITAVQLRYKTFEGIYHASVTNDGNGAGSRANAIALDSPNYFTRICEGGGKNCRTVSCADGYAAITGMMAKLSGKALQRAINSVVDHDRSGVDPTTGKSLGDLDGEERINSALQLLNIGSNEAMKLAQASIWDDMLYLGQQKFFADGRDFTSAAMINNARRQRNVQFASEGEMFKNAARPCMAFIEAFAYGIAPFAGILLMMGVFGIKLALKYFMLLLWVQSWLPVMAIVNSYMSSALRRGMLELQGLSSEYSNGAAFDSMYTVNKLAEVTSDWIGHSGLFLSLIPVLTLFLFSGSMYALTAFTNRMSGGDFINEKTHVPDALQNGPVVQGLPGATAALGVAKTGGYELGSISLSHGLSNSTVAAMNSVSQYASSFAASLGTGWSKNLSVGGEQAVQAAFQNSKSGMSTESQGTMDQLANGLQQKFGDSMSRGDAYSIASKLAMGFKAGYSVADMWGGGSFENEKNHVKNLSSNALEEFAQDSSNKALYDKQFSNEVATSVAGSLTTNQMFKQAATNSASQEGKLMRQASDVEQSSDSYLESKQKDQKFGFTENIALDQLAREINRNGGRGAVIQTARPLMDKYNADYQALQNYYMDAAAGDAGNAELMAAADLISRKGSAEQQMSLSTAYHGGFAGVELTSPVNRTGVDRAAIGAQLGRLAGGAQAGYNQIATNAGPAAKVLAGGAAGVQASGKQAMTTAEDWGRKKVEGTKQKADELIDAQTEKRLPTIDAGLKASAQEGREAHGTTTIAGDAGSGMKERAGALGTGGLLNGWFGSTKESEQAYNSIMKRWEENGHDLGDAVSTFAADRANEALPNLGVNGDPAQAAAVFDRMKAQYEGLGLKVIQEKGVDLVNQKYHGHASPLLGGGVRPTELGKYQDEVKAASEARQYSDQVNAHLASSEQKVRDAFSNLDKNDQDGVIHAIDSAGKATSKVNSTHVLQGAQDKNAMLGRKKNGNTGGGDGGMPGSPF